MVSSMILFTCLGGLIAGMLTVFLKRWWGLRSIATDRRIIHMWCGVLDDPFDQVVIRYHLRLTRPFHQIAIVRKERTAKFQTEFQRSVYIEDTHRFVDEECHVTAINQCGSTDVRSL